MATTQFTFTQSAGTSAKKFTVSMWWKPGTISTDQGLWGCGTGTSDAVSIHYTSADKLSLETFDGSLNPKLQTNRLFRDPTAWYHLVFSIDTTDSDADERLKIWINGVEETSFTTDTTITQDSDIPGWSAASDVMKIGNRWLDGDAYFDGLMAHVHVIDGTIYAASAFGETDSTSGIWVAKTSPSVTYGTNGGFYKFVSGALTTDSSGESNTLTSVGTPTTTKDTPDNNFATWNPLYMPHTGVDPVFSNGNTTVVTQDNASDYLGGFSTLGMVTGKWYAEFKAVTTNNYPIIGITQSPTEHQYNEDWLGNDLYDYGYIYNGNTVTNGVADVGWGAGYSAGDIVMVAVDLDNNKLYFGTNGTWANSGDPTSGSTGTGAAFTITSIASSISSIMAAGAYHFACSDQGTGPDTWNANFGNGYFATTAITDAGTSSSGDDSVWEYDCPTGYYGLNTINIATYG